jgi:hypothetical protein
MKITGKITIDVERRTISLGLDNGSWCTDLYTNGIKHFLDDLLDFYERRPETLIFHLIKGGKYEN